jgi:hypothetical protein
MRQLDQHKSPSNRSAPPSKSADARHGQVFNHADCRADWRILYLRQSASQTDLPRSQPKKDPLPFGKIAASDR